MHLVVIPEEASYSSIRVACWSKLHRSKLTCFAEVEAVSDILVDAYLQHPQYFSCTEVLGPACLQAAESLDFLGSLTGTL